MRKSGRRFLMVLLLLLPVFLQGAALAAASDGYQIRIYAGNVGATLGGSSMLTYTAAYGETISFDLSQVQLPPDSPYYVRGIRRSGLDNNAVSSSVIYVTEDADYVVAYGIRGNLVAYRVNYVDTNGNTLAPSQTYYGNVGDKPVVAYLYVDGYQPQAYNLTKTLSENEAGNVFTFVYTEIVVVTPTPEPTPTPTPAVVPSPGPTADPGAAGAAGSTAAPAEGETATPAPGDTPAPETEPSSAPETEQTAAPAGEETPAAGLTPLPAEEEITGEDVPLIEEPREIVDLDEEDTPLAGLPAAEKTDLQKDREQKQTKFFVSAALLAAALAVIAAMVLVLLKKRGRQS